jgi:hypothetical protein
LPPPPRSSAIIAGTPQAGRRWIELCVRACVVGPVAQQAAPSNQERHKLHARSNPPWTPEQDHACKRLWQARFCDVVRKADIHRPAPVASLTRSVSVPERWVKRLANGTRRGTISVGGLPDEVQFPGNPGSEHRHLTSGFAHDAIQGEKACLTQQSRPPERQLWGRGGFLAGALTTRARCP